MSSEEEDYMSEKFISNCIKDVRPGLVKNIAKEREHNVQAKKARLIDKQKKKSEISNAQKRLEESLKIPLTTENKGFSLLAKMGYKQGDSLGKSTNKGIVEPIGIVVKSDRAGLGRQAALVDLANYTKELRRKKLEAKHKGDEIITEQFRKRMVEKAESRFIESSLLKCQRTCEKLDVQDNYNSPFMKWFWPNECIKKGDDECSEEENDNEEQETYEPVQKLEMITNYLRTTYNYCHWCGIHYQNSGDLKDNCPGLNKDDH